MESKRFTKRNIIIIVVLFMIGIGFFINNQINADSSTTTSVLKPFDEAEKYKSEGKYRQAIDSYKLVTQDDKNYDVAQEKIKESTKLFIQDQISYAKKTGGEEKNYPAALAMINSGLEVDVNNKELLALKDEYAIAYKKAEEDRIAKIQAQVDEVKKNIKPTNTEQPKTQSSDKENMKIFENGSGLVGIAVTQTRVEGRYLWIDVCAINLSNKTQHVNPNDFTLSTLSGKTVNYSDKTFSVKEYFDAINLNPQNQASGWLAFDISDEKQYILHYNGLTGSVNKKIVLD